jgi:CRISPR type III-A-associated protein Csm2
MPANNRGGGYGGRGRYQQNQREEFRLSDGYLKNGYFNDTPTGKAIKTSLMMKTARDIALGLNSTWPKVKKTQLRKYYDYCKNLQGKMQLKSVGYEVIRPGFVKLLGHATNALNKSTPLVPRLFVEFVERNVNAVKDADDFNAFVEHFEMIVAYYSEERLGRGRK